jgi:hypothetical protein
MGDDGCCEKQSGCARPIFFLSKGRMTKEKHEAEKHHISHLNHLRRGNKITKGAIVVASIAKKACQPTFLNSNMFETGG